MDKLSVLPIHRLVYDKLAEYFNEKNKDKIFVYEFNEVVCKIRDSNGKNLPKQLRPILLDHYFTPKKIKELCDTLCWQLRFTRQDANEIMHDFIELGWISVKHGVVFLNKDVC